MSTYIDHKSVDDQLKEIITPSGKSYYHVQLQKARTIAIVLALSTIASLVFLVFAFVQKAAADTAREIARTNEIRFREAEAELARCKGIQEDKP